MAPATPRAGSRGESDSVKRARRELIEALRRLLRSKRGILAAALAEAPKDPRVRIAGEVENLAELVIGAHTYLLCRHPEHSRPGITKREEEIILLLAEGRKNRAIAASLGITESTVRSHVERLFQKFQVHSRPALLSKFWLSRNA